MLNRFYSQYEVIQVLVWQKMQKQNWKTEKLIYSNQLL